MLIRESVPPPPSSSVAMGGNCKGDGSNARKLSNWVELIRIVSLPRDGRVTRYWSTNVKSLDPGNNASIVQSLVANVPLVEVAGSISTTGPQTTAACC